MARNPNWTRLQTLLAFRLYCDLPFGKLSQGTPEVIALAKRIGRTPSAVGMKACNFASLDPAHRSRGVVGLKNRSQVEEQIWDDFMADSEAVALEVEAAHATIDPDGSRTDVEIDPERPRRQIPAAPEGPSEIERTVKVRRVQGFFRRAVLTGYGNRCALTGLAHRELLNASHILPWAEHPSRRADPRNGICLNALHDRAFDRGLMTFDEQLRVVVSPLLTHADSLGELRKSLLGFEGKGLRVSERFTVDAEALEWHRTVIFRAA